MYWDIIAATGWTYQYVENELTLPMVFDIMSAWSSKPPVHRMIASYLRYGEDKEGAKNKVEEKPLSEAELTSRETPLNDWSQVGDLFPITRTKKEAYK